MARADQDWHRHVVEQMLPRLDASLTEPATSFAPAPTTLVNAPTLIPGGLAAGPPGFDPIERLTRAPAAAERLRSLRDRSSEKHAAMIPHSELQEAIAERTLAEQNLRRLQAHAQDGGFGLPPTDARVAAAEQQVARTSDNARRVQERSEKLAAAWRAAAQPLAACEDLLRHGLPSGVQLLDYDGPEPVLLKGEKGLIDAIEGRARRVRELRADAHRIRSAPFPSSYAKQRLRQMVEQFAARAVPDVSSLIEHDQDIQWGTQQVRSAVYNAGPGATAFHDEVDVVGLFANLLKPAMISFLDTLVDAEQDDAAALTHEQRQQAEAEVMSDLLSVERDEAGMTWAAMEQGLPIEFRPDNINPIAILGVALRTVPRADALPPTSPGLSWPKLR